MFIGDSLVSWKSKKQQIMSKYSAEAKYRALGITTYEFLWLQALLTELKIDKEKTTTLYYDNHVALHIAENLVFHE